jgi:hypothetical protein
MIKRRTIPEWGVLVQWKSSNPPERGVGVVGYIRRIALRAGKRENVKRRIEKNFVSSRIIHQ